MPTATATANTGRDPARGPDATAAQTRGQHGRAQAAPQCCALLQKAKALYNDCKTLRVPGLHSNTSHLCRYPTLYMTHINQDIRFDQARERQLNKSH
jgi:hypothetical protein